MEYSYSYSYYSSPEVPLELMAIIYTVVPLVMVIGMGLIALIVVMCLRGKPRSKVAGALLAYFLGATGAHRFYLGYKGKGIVQATSLLGIATMFLPILGGIYTENALFLIPFLLIVLYSSAMSIWAFVDFIRILTGHLRPADGSGYKEDAAKAPVQPQLPQNDAAATLQRLKELHDSGLLSDEEYTVKREDVLKNL